MVFHGETIFTKQIQTATPTAGNHSLPGSHSFKPGQLKYFSLNNRGDKRNILETQLSLLKYASAYCVFPW